MFSTTKAKLLDSDDQSSVDSDKKGKIILKVGKLVGFLKIDHFLRMHDCMILFMFFKIKFTNDLFIFYQARKAAAAAEAKRQDMDDTTSEGSSVMEEEVNQIEELFTAIMQATDADNRSLSAPFTLLPSKKVYYY